MDKFTLPALEVFGRNKTDNVILCTLPELAAMNEDAKTRGKDQWTYGSNTPQRISWIGGKREESIDFARNGDLSAVATADALLSKLEHIAPMANAWEQYDSVNGAVPNIGAFLSGSPVNMRTRHRVRKESAPLSIIADLTSHAVIDAQKLRARGAAILALVRMLTALRPVELWAGCSLEASNSGASLIFTRIDSAPLDLARAAFMLASPAAARGLIYTVARFQHGFDGGFAYNVEMDKFSQNAHAVLARVVPTGSDLLYIPPIHGTHPSITEPVKWLEIMLARYGGEVLTPENA